MGLRTPGFEALEWQGRRRPSSPFEPLPGLEPGILGVENWAIPDECFLLAINVLINYCFCIFYRICAKFVPILQA